MGRVFGHTDARTIKMEKRLARWVDQENSRLPGLAQLIALVADKQKKLGPDHPDTFNTRANLVRGTWQAGEHATAQDMSKALLNDMGRVFGRTDSRTVKMRCKLAEWTNDMIPGREQLTALLVDQQEALGPDHPDTFNTRAYLVRWTWQAGEHATAQDMCRALLDDMGRVLGSANARTVKMRKRLAGWTNNEVVGIGEHTGPSRDRRQPLGRDRPRTFATRTRRANVAGQAGDFSAAREQYQALQEDQQRMLGPDHPDTFDTRASLVHWTGKAGERAAAQNMCRALLDDMDRVFGRTDTRTVKMRKRLARWTNDALSGRVQLADQQEVLFPDHRDSSAAHVDLTNQAKEPISIEGQRSELSEEASTVAGGEKEGIYEIIPKGNSSTEKRHRRRRRSGARKDNASSSDS